MTALLALLRALPLMWRLSLGLGALAAIGGAVGYFSHVRYQAGYGRAIHDIAVQDERATNAANEARDRVRRCNAADGMRWDTATGQCVRG